VDAVEIGVELVAAVGRPDEPTVAKPLEDAVDRVAVVVAPVGDLGDGSRLVEVVQHLECLSGQQLGELDVGVLADEVPIAFDGASIRQDDSFSPAIAFRVDEPLLDEVTDGTREITRCGRVSSRVRRSCRRGRLWRGPQAQYAGARCNILRNRFYKLVAHDVTEDEVSESTNLLNQQNYGSASFVG